MNFYEKRHRENNQLFQQHERAIDSIQNAIKREIPHLIHEFQLDIEEADNLNEYVNDKLTLFRFLRKNNYSLPTTLSLLLDTIRWRITQDIDRIRTCQLVDFLSQPLVYFHKQDRICRPVLVVQLAHLPQPSECDSAEFFTPLVIFILETARLLIWDLTQERIRNQVEDPIVLDMVVLIDFKNASSLPTDINLFKSFVTLLRRYPGLTGTVNLINFGWMYQGLWQMCKLVLSKEAKAKVNFPKPHELKQLIKDQDLIKALGGQDDFEWSLSQDKYYTKYRPPLVLSRRSSSSSIYYDSLAMTQVTRPPSSFSLYATPSNSLTPVASHTNLTSLARAYSSISLSSKLGNGMPPRLRTTIRQLSDFLHHVPSSSNTNHESISWLLSQKLDRVQQEQEQFSPPVPNNPQNWFMRLIARFEHTLRQVTLRILGKMVKYQRTVYWVVACVLLRNGVQELVQHLSLLILEVLFAGQKTSSLGINTLLQIGSSQMTL